MKKYNIKINNKTFTIDAQNEIAAIKKIRDMALSRADAMDRCINLGKKFIEHFDKIYKEPKSQARNHWEGEMQNWLNSVKQIKLKSTNDIILNGDLRDWFFTAGANPQDFMKNPINEELKIYDNFITNLVNGNKVKTALNSVGIK